MSNEETETHVCDVFKFGRCDRCDHPCHAYFEDHGWQEDDPEEKAWLQSLSDEAEAEAAIEMAEDYARDKRLAEILGVDVEIVIALLPDDDIVPDELWQAALEQVRRESHA